VIYLHRAKNIAVNEEVIDDAVKELGIEREELEKVKTAEVGNIFNFGSQKTDEMDLYFTDEHGEQKSLFIGSYGIGVTRVMGVIAEKLSDDKGLVWPEAIAPAKVYLARLGSDGEVIKAADELYGRLTESGIGVLYDDREEARPGEKFADADLMGIPYRVVVSAKTVAADSYEVKHRTSDDAELLKVDELLAKLRTGGGR
jgi:prolyl-tRNA synthetase